MDIKDKETNKPDNNSTTKDSAEEGNEDFNEIGESRRSLYRKQIHSTYKDNQSQMTISHSPKELDESSDEDTKTANEEERIASSIAPNKEKTTVTTNTEVEEIETTHRSKKPKLPHGIKDLTSHATI